MSCVLQKIAINPWFLANSLTIQVYATLANLISYLPTTLLFRGTMIPKLTFSIIVPRGDTCWHVKNHTQTLNQTKASVKVCTIDMESITNY